VILLRLADQALTVRRRTKTPSQRTFLLKTPTNTSLDGLPRFLHLHSQRISATLAALLMGTGATAFAVANLAPDPADLPVHQVLQQVQPVDLAAQADALESRQLDLYRSDTSRSTDTPESLLARLGVTDPAAANFLRTDGNVRQQLLGRSGKAVTAQAGADSSLLRLTARWSAEGEREFKRLVVQKSGTGFTSRIESAPLTTSTRLAGGVIQSSLFAATDEARIPDSVAPQIAEIFSGDIDFHRALRKGDTFSVVYEALTADGEPITWNQGAGQVLAAEFVNNGHAYQSLWYRDASGKGAFFGFDGQSKRRAFLASPMEFSRVTSGFAMRMHPILNQWRAHKGVDYGAPSGTPVRAVAQGIVKFAGRQNGYGNVVEVEHGNGVVAAIDAPAGSRVRQGQRIVRLQPSPATTAQWQSVLAEARAAQDALARSQRLRSDGLAGQAEVEAAQARWATADAQRRTLQARLAQLDLRAPAAGDVQRMMVNVGDLLAPGTPVASLAAAGAGVARFGIDPAQIGSLHVGAPVQVQPLDGRPPFAANVRSLSRAIDPQTRLAAFVDPFAQIAPVLK